MGMDIKHLVGLPGLVLDKTEEYFERGETV
jgi:hypothetical protein